MNVSTQSIRNTIYFDESGVPSLNDENRFFVLTGVIGNNLEFYSLAEYYFRLKLKYFKEEKELHSSVLFWQPNTRALLFIKELVEYLETLEFAFLTVTVDKHAVLKEAPKTTPRNPYNTTFSQAKSLWKRDGFSQEKFGDRTVDEVLNIVKQKYFADINNYYPLKIAYYTILKKYLDDYTKKRKLENSNFEICFETSPNRERILKYTEEFFEEKNTDSSREKTNFAKSLKENVYSISFPNKNAKYLGLEIADIISYGFGLSRNKRIKKVPSYREVWDIILKRRMNLKKDYDIECVYKIPG
jgi:hypothetical protein